MIPPVPQSWEAALARVCQWALFGLGWLSAAFIVFAVVILPLWALVLAWR